MIVAGLKISFKMKNLIKYPTPEYSKFSNQILSQCINFNVYGGKKKITEYDKTFLN